jgi:hypothetical protein
LKVNLVVVGLEFWFLDGVIIPEKLEDAVESLFGGFQKGGFLPTHKAIVHLPQ